MGFETQNKLEEILKNRKVKIIPLDLPPIGSEGLEFYDPTSFSVTISGMRNPVILAFCDGKQARACSRKVVKRQVSNNENTKTMLGEYSEVINTFRRNNYKIEFVESFSPQIVT